MKNNFNKGAFALLLKKAIGSQTQKAFAEQAGISKEHLSRLINQKLDFVPSIDTLKAISRNTSEVSYSELLEAAGYLEDTGVNFTQTVFYNESGDLKPLTATILTSISQFGAAWSVDKGTDTSSPDLSIMLEDCPLKTWTFHFMNNTFSSAIDSQFDSNMLNLVFQTLAPDSKYSFVTASVSEYEKYTTCIPRNLSINLSIILVDQVSLKVVKETILQRNGHFSDDLLNQYTF